MLSKSFSPRRDTFTKTIIRKITITICTLVSFFTNTTKFYIRKHTLGNAWLRNLFANNFLSCALKKSLKWSYHVSRLEQYCTICAVRNSLRVITTKTCEDLNIKAASYGIDKVWFRKLKAESYFDTKDQPRSSRLIGVDCELLNQMIDQDKNVSTWAIALKYNFHQKAIV